MSRFAFFNRSNTVLHRAAPSSEPSEKPYLLERSGSLDGGSMETTKSNSIHGRMVKKLCSLFESTHDSSKLSPAQKSTTEKSAPSSKPKQSCLKPKDSSTTTTNPLTLFRLPDAEDRVVVYFTSLRGIRRTFEDCSAVRMILKGFRIWIDERDVSMDAEYRKELQRVLGEEKNGVALPQVFVRGKYIGGADVIKHLFEAGELGKILEGFPKTKPGFVCESCGDMRFAPCSNCSGSRKVFDEDEGMLKRCWECNENGLIRCPDCCY